MFSFLSLKMTDKRALRYLQKQGWNGANLDDVTCESLGLQLRFFKAEEYLLSHWQDTSQHQRAFDFFFRDAPLKLYTLSRDREPLFWSISHLPQTIPILLNNGIDLDFESPQGKTWLGKILQTSIYMHRFFPEYTDRSQEALTLLISHGADVWRMIDGQTIFEMAQGTPFEAVIFKGIKMAQEQLQTHLSKSHVQSRPSRIKRRL